MWFTDGLPLGGSQGVAINCSSELHCLLILAMYQWLADLSPAKQTDIRGERAIDFWPTTIHT